MRMIIKLLLPPIVISLCRKLRHKKSISFSGIFNSIDEIQNENPWIKKSWIDISNMKLEKTIMNKCANNFIPASDFNGYPVFICLVVNLLSENKSCNILDFSGGTGFIYFKIYPYLLNPGNVIWHVVDNNNKLLEIGKEHADNQNFHNICFYNEIPANDEINLDVIFTNSSLQYMYDYNSILNRLLHYRPKYIVLTRLIAGDIETYITCQNVVGYNTPCIFLNAQEVVKIFLENGYKLVFKSPCSEENFIGHYDSNIPKSLHIPYSVNLIFSKCDIGAKR